MEPGHSELFKLVMSLMKWDEWTTHVWFNTPNPLLGGIEPDRMIWIGRREELELLIKGCIEGSPSIVPLMKDLVNEKSSCSECKRLEDALRLQGLALDSLSMENYRLKTDKEMRI